MALRDAERNAEPERFGRVDGAVGVDTHGPVAFELRGDRREIGCRSHAENGFALRGAGLDRLRQRGSPASRSTTVEPFWQLKTVAPSGAVVSVRPKSVQNRRQGRDP